ncbi:MAG: hypothetical protein ACLPKT_02230, partial [Methylocella sp.]
MRTNTSSNLRRTARRLFVSCFSSSIHRIKLTVDMAREHGRKICFIGRS